MPQSRAFPCPKFLAARMLRRRGEIATRPQEVAISLPAPLLVQSPSNPQWSEREVARALDADNNQVLLQVGEDITGEGCLCYFIDAGDCFHQRFDQCWAVWGQT
jgi:hypothetical protein